MRFDPYKTLINLSDTGFLVKPAKFVKKWVKTDFYQLKRPENRKEGVPRLKLALRGPKLMTKIG